VSFYLEASLPAYPDFLETIQDLLKQAYLCVGFPENEASDMADGIAGVVGVGLSGTSPGRQIRLRFRREGDRFHVDVGAEHLPAAPASVAFIDQVSVHREGPRTMHRFTRELPRS